MDIVLWHPIDIGREPSMWLFKMAAIFPLYHFPAAIIKNFNKNIYELIPQISIHSIDILFNSLIGNELPHDATESPSNSMNMDRGFQLTFRASGLMAPGMSCLKTNLGK